VAGMTGEAARFLLCGGFAALVNWAARIALSSALPFEAAVGLAYVIGMTVGFLLYRTVVWADREGTLGHQLASFVLVNAGSAIVVFGFAIGMRNVAQLFVGPSEWVDAAAHGLAIGAGAVANFVGHRAFTFGRSASEA
jgi:energy-coupling factor transport system substrate-specific component